MLILLIIIINFIYIIITNANTTLISIMLLLNFKGFDSHRPLELMLGFPVVIEQIKSVIKIHLIIIPFVLFKPKNNLSHRRKS